MLHQELTREIIGAFYEVHSTLQYGMLEKVYENALMVELQKRGLQCEQQKRIQVFYQGIEVGVFFSDICVEKLVTLEIKAASEILTVHEIQLLNYLKASDIEVGLLLNFGLSARLMRKEVLNETKPWW